MRDQPASLKRLAGKICPKISAGLIILRYFTAHPGLRFWVFSGRYRKKTGKELCKLSGYQAIP